MEPVGSNEKMSAVINAVTVGWTNVGSTTACIVVTCWPPTLLWSPCLPIKRRSWDTHRVFFPTVHRYSCQYPGRRPWSRQHVSYESGGGCRDQCQSNILRIKALKCARWPWTQWITRICLRRKTWIFFIHSASGVKLTISSHSACCVCHNQQEGRQEHDEMVRTQVKEWHRG